MNYPQLTFQIRIKSRESLRQLGQRIDQVFGCQFVQSYDPMFLSNEGSEALCLGLQVMLSHDPAVSEGDLRTYVLMGRVRDDIEAELSPDSERINISPYILGVLSIADSKDWYIASPKELADETGLKS